MTVGILTYHCAYSYGAVLQAYALAKSIESLGQRVSIINYKPTTRRDTKWYDFFFKVRSPGSLIEFFNQYRRECVFKSFINVLCQTDRYVKVDDFKERPLGFDAYVCGSDQIWHPKQFAITGYYDSVYFLSFCEKRSIRVAYAPSFGCAPDANFIRAISQHLRRFDTLSIREESSVQILEQVVGRKVYNVCDPTLLLGRRGFDDLTKGYERTKFCKKKGGLLIFPLGGLPRADFLKKVQQGFSSTTIIGRPFRGIFYGDNIIPSPVEWIELIKTSDFVITNSFHGTVFCILYHKPFYTYAWPDESKNIRVRNLLLRLGLSHRFIPSDYKLVDTTTDISWSDVDYKLSQWREESFVFLKMALCMDEKNGKRN